MGFKNKKVPIDYTARDYNSIRQSLVDHAKRYYPKTYQDFNEAGFGSLMIDSVAYIGDILSLSLCLASLFHTVPGSSSSWSKLDNFCNHADLV